MDTNNQPDIILSQGSSIIDDDGKKRPTPVHSSESLSLVEPPDLPAKKTKSSRQGKTALIISTALLSVLSAGLIVALVFILLDSVNKSSTISSLEEQKSSLTATVADLETEISDLNNQIDTTIPTTFSFEEFSSTVIQGIKNLDGKAKFYKQKSKTIDSTGYRYNVAIDTNTDLIVENGTVVDIGEGVTAAGYSVIASDVIDFDIISKDFDDTDVRLYFIVKDGTVGVSENLVNVDPTVSPPATFGGYKNYTNIISVRRTTDADFDNRYDVIFTDISGNVYLDSGAE